MRELVEQDPVAWSRLLESTRMARSQAWCLCRGEPSELAMYVARHGNTLALKRAPGSGPKHHPNCPSYAEESTILNRSLHAHPAIERMDDGGLRIQIDVPLRTLKAPALPKAHSARNEQRLPGHTRKTLTLLGLLEVLWERAGLHRWHPQAGPRLLGAVYRKLIEESFEVAVGRAAGADIIYIPDTRLDEPSMQRKVGDIKARFRALNSICKTGEVPILLMVGEVRALFDARYGSGMRLKGLPDSATIWLSRELAGDVSRRFEAPVRRFLEGKSYTGKIFCITGVQISSNGSLNATSCSFMETSGNFIPVDSRHELVFSDYLVENRRHFTKPLRFSASDETHPDFILHDTPQGDWYLEIWGMNTPEYNKKKQQKIDSYRLAGKRLWQWDARRSKEFGPIPGRT